MKRLIKIEKERLLSSKTFYKSILIPIIIALSQIIIQVKPPTTYII